MKRTILIETLWIIGFGIISIITVGLFIGFDNLLTLKFDIQVHDTYFVMSPLITAIPIFLLLNFLTLSIRVVKNKFSNTITNFFLIIITGFLILSLTSVVESISKFEHLTGGWTVYPPSSSVFLNDPDANKREVVDIISNIVSFLQPVLLVMLILSAVLTGYKMKINNA